jgi:hypothetical protein
MEKTLQQQYTLIKEGKGNKDHFLKSARRVFPEYITPNTDYDTAVHILKGKSILNEGVGGIATLNPNKPDWFKIFDTNLKEAVGVKDTKEYGNQNSFDKIDKETEETLSHQFDNKDDKNIDNVYGQSFLMGYYTEMKDPKNEGKTVDELKQIVLKNMTKDINYYHTEASFGVKGIGYTSEAPGAGIPKEPKGKYKSSGYGDLKESYEASISKIFTSENEAYSKLKGKEYQELADFFNKEKNTNLPATWFQSAKFSEFPYDTRSVIRKFLKTKNYLKENKISTIDQYIKSEKDSNIKNKLTKIRSKFLNKTQLSSEETKFIKDLIPSLVNENKDTEIKIGDILIKNGKKGKVIKVMDDMVNVDFGNGDVYGITLSRIKGNEIVNENKDTDLKIYQSELNMLNKIKPTGEKQLKRKKELEDKIASLQTNESKIRSLIHNLILEELNEAKRPAVSTEIKEIEKTNEALALEAKIKSIDEAIEKRQAKLNLAESEELAEMIDKNMVKTLQKEIKELEKYKAKASKMYEKMTGSAKKEMIDEEENIMPTY